MNRRDFTLALGTTAVSGGSVIERAVVAPAVAVEPDDKWLYTLLALREMAQHTLTNLEVNRKALVDNIAKLDAEIERERKK
jgi:hypothetical protein